MEFITTKKLLENNDNPILILDVRNKNSFNDWNIRGSINIDVSDDIWDNNFEKVKQMFEGLPKDKKIVTVCNAGITSQHASRILEEMGYKTLVLEHGMMGWNKLHKEAEVINKSDLLIKQIARVGKGCLSYLIGSKSAKECFIVDPSQFVDEYVIIANDVGLKIKGIIETHVHADHLSGAKSLANITKAKYYVSGADLSAKIDFVDLDQINEISIGINKIKIIPTPGHTNGSVCLIVNDQVLITGDTLFLEGAGRPDLGRSREDIKRGALKLYESLNLIKKMYKNLIVLPAHFTSCNELPISVELGVLLDKNKILKFSLAEDFVEYITSNLPMVPPNYEQIKRLNMECTNIPLQIGEKLEFGPNRCASR